MAFSNTVLKAGMLSDGRAFEYGTFNGASVATGTVTAGAGTGFPTNCPKVAVVLCWSAASDSDSAALAVARDAGDATLKLTFTSGDTGTYYIEGLTAGS